MNPVRMYDRGAAIIASQISNAFGQKTSPNDFIPYGKETDKNDELDGEELITALMSTGRAKIGR